MNPRERFLAVLDFKPVDRVPQMDFGYWDETYEVWHAQGMPREITTQRQLEAYFGIDESYEYSAFLTNTTPNSYRGLCPPFEREVLQDEGDRVLVRDVDGTIQRETKTYRSIPQFLRFPVSNRAEYEALLWRLDGSSPGRYPADWDAQVAALLQTLQPIGLRLDGFFGWPRKLMGLETLSLAYFDDPELVETINQNHVRMIKEMVPRALRDLRIEYVTVWEDMAYKGGSLISPRFFLRFMLPYYHELAAFLHGEGVRHILVDCDGDVRQLAALFIEAGVTGLYPCERAAGSDPAELRQRYPRLALLGGVDKRALIIGPEAIERELTHLEPVIREGGFIPGVDHRVPPDVPLDHYRYFCARRREVLARI